MKSLSGTSGASRFHCGTTVGMYHCIRVILPLAGPTPSSVPPKSRLGKNGHQPTRSTLEPLTDLVILDKNPLRYHAGMNVRSSVWKREHRLLSQRRFTLFSILRRRHTSAARDKDSRGIISNLQKRRGFLSPRIHPPG